MKKILIFLAIVTVASHASLGQQAGLTVYAIPTLTNVKYADFNTFADGYNAVNGTNLELPKFGIGFSTGAEVYYDFFYFGFNYNKLTLSPDPITISNFSKRNFDLKLTSYISNVGWNIGFKAFSVTPYMICGMNYVDLDTYITYFEDYKSYGNYKLDGTYSGTNILYGFGLKANYFYKIFFASVGFSRMYSIFPTASIHDFGAKGDPVLGGGYTDIGTDWATYTSGNSWDYTGKFMSSANKQFMFQLTAGIFIGASKD